VAGRVRCGGQGRGEGESWMESVSREVQAERACMSVDQGPEEAEERVKVCKEGSEGRRSMVGVTSVKSPPPTSRLMDLQRRRRLVTKEADRRYCRVKRTEPYPSIPPV
jgi:hypothetical protein